jgi:hypothetical protein
MGVRFKSQLKILDRTILIFFLVFNSILSIFKKRDKIYERFSY